MFEMELIAGVPDFNATMKEHDNTFSFDFSKVYWNSKLQTEHYRISHSIIQPGEVQYSTARLYCIVLYSVVMCCVGLG